MILGIYSRRGGGVLHYERLMTGLIHGVAVSIELLEWGRTFSDIWGKTVLHIYG